MAGGAHHWSDRYLGEPYLEGKFDCADFAVRVQREIFGRTVVLPSDHGSGPFGRTAVLSANQDDYLREIVGPEDGCAILFKVVGRVQHMGVLCIIAGEMWVLHNQKGLGVTRKRLREMASLGYEVMGFYAWI